MFDLEDAVSMAEKDAARVLVYEALKTQDYGNAELVVRINGLDTKYYADDVKAMVKAGIDVIRCPKVESATMISRVEKDVAAAEAEFKIPVGTTHLMAAVESAKGVLNAPAIAAASDRMIGIALSAEDYTTDNRDHLPSQWRGTGLPAGTWCFMLLVPLESPRSIRSLQTWPIPMASTVRRGIFINYDLTVNHWSTLDRLQWSIQSMNQPRMKLLRPKKSSPRLRKPGSRVLVLFP